MNDPANQSYTYEYIYTATCLHSTQTTQIARLRDTFQTFQFTADEGYVFTNATVAALLNSVINCQIGTYTIEQDARVLIVQIKGTADNAKFTITALGTDNYNYLCTYDHAYQTSSVEKLGDVYKIMTFEAVDGYKFTQASIMTLTSSMSNCELIQDPLISNAGDTMVIYIYGTANNAQFTVCAVLNKCPIVKEFTGYAYLSPDQDYINSTDVYSGKILSSNSDYIVNSSRTVVLLDNCDVTSQVYTSSSNILTIDLASISIYKTLGNIIIRASTDFEILEFTYSPITISCASYQAPSKLTNEYQTIMFKAEDGYLFNDVAIARLYASSTHCTIKNARTLQNGQVLAFDIVGESNNISFVAEAIEAQQYTFAGEYLHARQNTSYTTLSDVYKNFIFEATFPYTFDQRSISVFLNSLYNCEVTNSPYISVNGSTMSVDIKGSADNASFTVQSFYNTYTIIQDFTDYITLAPTISTLENTSVYTGYLRSSNVKYTIDHTKTRVYIGNFDITKEAYNGNTNCIILNMPALLQTYPMNDITIHAETTYTGQKYRIIGDYDNSDKIKYYIDNNITTPRFRIYVLYQDETINYEIPQTDIQIGGSYSENYQNGQRRALSFTLINEDGKYTPDINTFWAGTRLRLDMGVEAPDGEVFWFRKGVFVINQITPNLRNGSKIVQVSAGDKFSLFENSTGKLESTYEIGVNTDIETLIHDTLRKEMGSGYPLDSQPIIYNSKFRGKVTQVIITKNAGETLGSLLLDLATQLSAEIYYNENGNLVLVPIEETTMDKNKPLLYNFNTDHGDINELSFAFDYNSVINRVIVVGTSVSGGTFTAEAVNDDAGSPLCYQRIGYRTDNIINDSNIHSVTLAQERADYELRQKLIMKSAVNASVLFNPLLQVNNIITISDDFFKLYHTRFLLQSISCSLDYSNQMSITFSNLNNLPFAIN